MFKEMKTLIIIHVMFIYSSHDLPFCICVTHGQRAKLYNRPKYSSTHYTLRTILLNGCTDSHRRAIRRVTAKTSFTVRRKPCNF